ncbi:MAG: ABC transporter ATP-binding protein [Myxococcaceae bacterium]
MRILWHYLRPLRWLVGLALLLASVAQVLALYDPVIFGHILDRYALNKGQLSDAARVQGVTLWLGIAVAVALVARLARSLQEFMVRLVVQRFGTQLFNDGLRQTLRLPFEDFEEQTSGQILSVLQKVREDTEKFITSLINVLFAALVGVAFLLWYAVTRSWLLVPVFAVGVVLLGGLTGLLSQRIKRLQRSVVKQTNAMSGAITESLRNIELVKSLGLTVNEIRRLQGYTQAIYELEMGKTRRTRTLSFLQGSALILLRQSILFMLLWLIFHRQLSPGELISMQFISTGIIAPLQELGTIILAWREAEASLQTFDALMKRPHEYRAESPVDVGAVERLRFDHVFFTYRHSASPAVEDISFEARLGDTLAFVGPSGSGKSTLVKLLVGLYRPSSGGIFYDDVSIDDLRYNRIRRQMGFVTQQTQLFSGTIRDNMRFVRPEATDAQIVDAMEQAQCAHLISGPGKGLDTVLGEDGRRLSGGERQRLAIARALLRDPRILIFDEATSALDALTEEEVSRTVEEVATGARRIVVHIAHRLSTIMHADTIYVLERGRIVERGTHAELLEQKGLYWAMWRQQIGERGPAPATEPAAAAS